MTSRTNDHVPHQPSHVECEREQHGRPSTHALLSKQYNNCLGLMSPAYSWTSGRRPPKQGVEALVELLRRAHASA
eukprot:478057-Pleurochrysis_carterae.AAC.1